MAVLATRTGQKVGTAKITRAPIANTISARTTAPRLRPVASMAAPAGVCAARPRSPLIVVTQPTSVWLQCCWVIRKTLRYGPSAPRTSASRKLTASSDRGRKPACCACGRIPLSSMRLEHRDQEDAARHQRATQDAPDVQAVLFDAEPPEMVDRQRHQDVCRDGQARERAGADSVDEEKPSDDRKCADNAAERRPPRHSGKPLRRRQRAGEYGGDNDEKGKDETERD